jgi:integrase/recombinase XerD
MASDANAGTLHSFLDYLRVERGSAKLTIAAYASDLMQFADFLEKRRLALHTARREDVREFVQELFSNALDGRSVGRKLSAIRQLYRHLLLDGKIEKDPTLNIDLPKQWKVLPKALSRDEVGAMLGERKLGERQPSEPAPRNETARGQALALRDRAMIELLYGGGVRVSEVADARLEDLKLEMGYILVRGKGDKERMVPLGVPAQQALQRYLQKARPALTSSKTKIAKSSAFLRNAYGRERRRSAHRANHPRPRRHFDDADLYPRCARPPEKRVREASSASENEELDSPRRHGDTEKYQWGFCSLGNCQEGIL